MEGRLELVILEGKRMKRDRGKREGISGKEGITERMEWDMGGKEGEKNSQKGTE